MEFGEVIKNIGLKIKRFRLTKGLTQIDLASLCNIEQSSIARIEAGKTNPTIRTLLKIAEVLEIDIKQLL